MNLYKLLIIAILFTGYISGQNLSAQQSSPEIGIDEKLDQFVPGDINLVTSDGDSVTTKELFTKPTVLSLVYFRCPGICTPLTDALADVIKHCDLTIGKDYQVLTVSFNPTEGTDLARQKKKNYIALSGLDSSATSGWIFCTSDSSDIARLTKSVGFRYKPNGTEFVHPAALIFLSPEGKVTRYINGSHFQPFDLKMGIVEASKGVSGPTINKVLQYCFNYDPSGNKYTLNITRVAGALIVGLAVIFFISLISVNLIRKKRAHSKN